VICNKCIIHSCWHLSWQGKRCSNISKGLCYDSSAPMKRRSPKRVTSVWSPNYVSTMAPIVVTIVSKILTTFNSSSVNGSGSVDGSGNVNGIAIGSGGVGPSISGHGLVPTFNLLMDFVFKLQRNYYGVWMEKLQNLLKCQCKPHERFWRHTREWKGLSLWYKGSQKQMLSNSSMTFWTRNLFNPHW